MCYVVNVICESAALWVLTGKDPDLCIVSAGPDISVSPSAAAELGAPCSGYQPRAAVGGEELQGAHACDSPPGLFVCLSAATAGEVTDELN